MVIEKLSMKRRTNPTNGRRNSKNQYYGANNNLNNGLYLDMIIEKFYRVTEVVSWNSEVLIERTNGLIKVIIPIPSELQGKSGYTVYRYHGNAVNVISTVPNGTPVVSGT